MARTLLFNCVFMSIHSFLYFLRWEKGGYDPPSHPPKSATVCVLISLDTAVNV